jgi:2-succinyl-5-enolpyruvyl-6-hydroxy-3-cyclohexene-1-carboxylate synthase
MYLRAVAQHLQHVGSLVAQCKVAGVKTIVFSPGSRNAPLVTAFNKAGNFECLVVPDERSAAFFALGIAQQTGTPVAVCCTSGSAVVNYFPAVTEAYYSKIPLLLLTADRPSIWIDKGDGQTIRQKNVFADYVRTCLHLEFNKEQDEVARQKEIFFTLKGLMLPEPLPVHINIALEEPLYGEIPTAEGYSFQQISESVSRPDFEVLEKLWNQAASKLILTGVLADGGMLSPLVQQLCVDPSVAVLAETTSNLNVAQVVYNTDRILAALTENSDQEQYKPDVLITLGHSIISKKIKVLIRKWAVPHVHVSLTDHNMDTFGTLVCTVRAKEEDVLRHIAGIPPLPTDSTFGAKWKSLEYLTEQWHNRFIETAPWSDLQAYRWLMEYTPDYVNLQMGNSAAVRYLQLMPHISTLLYNGNRGVSGIDGCVSTAAGAAHVNASAGVNTLLVCGDMSFLYDSNALWCRHLSSALRIAVVNNGGGGIFRIIDGPKQSDYLETFFQAEVPVDIQALCRAYNIHYYRCCNEQDIHRVMPDFLLPQMDDRPALIEIFTPPNENDIVLNQYFSYIATSFQNYQKENPNVYEPTRL